MERIIFYIALCLVLPIGLLCFFLEERSKRIMMSVMGGILACFLAYFLNTWLSKLLSVNHKYYVSTFAPIVEELLKMVPVLSVVLVLKKGVRESIANSFSVGVGFCIVENFFYLFENMKSANVIWVIARCIGTGLMHSMSAVILGLGVYYAAEYKRVRLLGVLTSVSSAFIYHGMYNLLVNSGSFMPVGVCLPIVTFIIIVIFVKTGKYKGIFSERSEDEIYK